VSQAQQIPRSQGGGEPEELVAIPVRHPWRGVAGAAVVAALGLLALAVAGNEQFDFAVVPKYLFDPVVLSGVKTTLALTTVAMAVGVALGVVAAVWRLSPNPVLRWTSAGYVWFFRGTPVLVQLIFWFNIGIVFPNITLGVPFTDFELWGTNTNRLVTPFVAAILGLGLNEGAYVAEIVRGGIISVGKGQVEAAAALGMRPNLAMRRIVLPQAVPVVIPPLGNELIGMLKYSALASVIAVSELLGSVADIYSTNLQTLELLVVASIWYLACTSALTVGQRFLEKYFGRSRGSAAGDSRLVELARRMSRARA